MNIVIYARFSSHAQNEQSIEGQLSVCHEFAKKNDYTVIGEYIDRAISGKTDNRPEFLRMIEDSHKKHFQGILCYQLDRFARNRYDSAIYKAKLKKNGVRVLSARENITNDASGILIKGLLESMAEYYSAELSQKIRRGMNINASKCLATGGNVALGYYVDENKHFQINEDEAVIVRKIFEMYAASSTMAEIIRYLNSQQILTGCYSSLAIEMTELYKSLPTNIPISTNCSIKGLISLTMPLFLAAISKPKVPVIFKLNLFAYFRANKSSNIHKSADFSIANIMVSTSPSCRLVVNICFASTFFILTISIQLYLARKSFCSILSAPSMITS